MEFQLSSCSLVEEATRELQRIGFDVPRPQRTGPPTTLTVQIDDPGTALKAERVVLFLDPAAVRADE